MSDEARLAFVKEVRDVKAEIQALLDQGDFETLEARAEEWAGRLSEASRLYGDDPTKEEER